MQFAHKKNITFNELCEEAIQEKIEKIDEDNNN